MLVVAQKNIGKVAIPLDSQLIVLRRLRKVI